jgi:hypothetical protein
VPTRRRRYLIIFLAWLSLCGAALAETVAGNGVMRTQDRAATGFTGITLAIPARLEVKLGPTEGITIEADENLLPLIETAVKGNSLAIKPVRRNLNLESRGIRVVVQAKQVDRLAIGGSGSITADALRGKDLALDIGGSGEIDIKRADADRVSVAIGGSGDVQVAGAAKHVKIAIGGSGTANAKSLVTDAADVTIAGAGDASVAARASLNVTIVGSGDVNYWGEPSLSKTVLGSGSIKHAGPLPR